MLMLVSCKCVAPESMRREQATRLKWQKDTNADRNSYIAFDEIQRRMRTIFCSPSFPPTFPLEIIQIVYGILAVRRACRTCIQKAPQHHTSNTQNRTHKYWKQFTYSICVTLPGHCVPDNMEHPPNKFQVDVDKTAVAPPPSRHGRIKQTDSKSFKMGLGTNTRAHERTGYGRGRGYRRRRHHKPLRKKTICWHSDSVNGRI